MKLKFTKSTLWAMVLLSTLLLYGCTDIEKSIDAKSDIKKQEINEIDSNNQDSPVTSEEAENSDSEVSKAENTEELPVYIRINNDDTKPVTDLYPYEDGNGLYGLIDSNGAVVIPGKYDLIKETQKDYVLAFHTNKNNSEKEYYDPFGNKIDEYWIHVPLNSKGEEIIGYFRDATGLSEDVILVQDGLGYLHTMNIKGEILFSLERDDIIGIYEYHDGLARFCTQERLYGYLDKELNVVIKPIYSEAKDFSEGLAFVTFGETVGYINTAGEMVIDLSGTGASDWAPEHGFLPYYFDGDNGFNGYSGYNFSEGLAYVTIPRTEYEEDYLGYFLWDHDENGKRIIDPEHYKDIPKGYYIDKNGNKVLDGVVGTEFVCGLAAARDPETGKVGYIDKTGKFVIEPQFELAYPFRESGFAMVSYGENGHYLPDLLMGCVNTNGEIIIPVEYAGFHLPPFDISSGEIIEFLKENPDGSATLCYFDSKGTLLGMIDSTFYKPKIVD